jgi:hypothetical protein
MQDAARDYKNTRSVRELYIDWKYTDLNCNVARDKDQVVASTLARQFQKMFQSEEIARVSLQTYLDIGSPMSSAASSTFEDRGSIWPQHYRAAEAYSDTLPSMLNNCLQIWARPREDESNRGRSDVFHRSPLHLCSAFGFKALGEVYLQMGKDPNILAHPDGQTALHLASAGGHIGMMEKLLGRDADIEKTTFHTGRTALQVAAAQGHGDAVQILLEAGADVDATDKLGHTALELAAQNGHEEIVELLIIHKWHNSMGLGWHEETTCDRPRPTSLGSLPYEEGPKHEKNRTHCTNCKHTQHTAKRATRDNRKEKKQLHRCCCHCGKGPNRRQCGGGPEPGHCSGQTKSSEVDEGWIAVDHHQKM